MVILALLAVSLQAGLAAGACPAQPAGASSDWLDSSTPADACTKPICTGSFQQCNTRAPVTEDLVLVFSDEFNDDQRNFVGQAGDTRWTAQDMYYSSDYREWQNYKPDKVSVSNGSLQITFANETTEAVLNSVEGPKLVKSNKTSGMVQSWNKWCFTGGYVEFGIQLPGTAIDSGLWAAAWLEGNLGRAGHYKSTRGRWPYSYNSCSGSGVLDWSFGQPGQRASACKNGKGRGAPEIDVLEYGIFPAPGSTSPVPTFVHTMQMAPVAPPFTSWMNPEPAGSNTIPGIHIPGANSPAALTYLGNTYGELTRLGYPRTGNNLTDTYTASSLLGPEYFSSYHKYAVLWEPGEYVRWYLDDEFLFEVNKDALRAQANSLNQSIEDRLIPVEAMYLIINVAMADTSWSRVSDSLALPAVMSVDYVRVWQRANAINVGCNPRDYPTAQEIACHADEYLSPDELGSWDLGVCNSIASRDNTLLLSFGVTVAAVGLGAVAMMWVMNRRIVAEEAAAGKLSLEEDKAAGASDRTRQASCYLSSDSTRTAELLLLSRPDLIAVAASRSASKSKH